jgi:hypothetical protein
MAQFQPELSDVINCVDIFAEIKEAQWLVQSMEDAISEHWEKPDLTNHLAYLIHEYSDKIKELIPKLDQAFEKVQPTFDANELWRDLIRDAKKRVSSPDNVG